MNDDVNTLREAAAEYREYGEKFCLRMPLAIVFRVVADMIEREGAQELASQSTGHHIHLLSYDKGWNDAISAVHVKLADVEYGAAILNRVAALRREPRT